jgi:hypothetical protein
LRPILGKTGTGMKFTADKAFKDAVNAHGMVIQETRWRLV